jgi:hypothetical protein
MRESGSPEIRAPRETDCGRIGSAELLRSRRRRCRHRSSGLAMIELPGVIESGMPRKNGQRKPGTTRGSPRRSRTAKALRISRHAVKSRCARGWGGWGRLSDDGSRQHNSGKSEDPWGGGYPTSMAAHDRASLPTQCGISEVALTCAKGRYKPNISRCMPGAGLSRPMRGKVLPYMPAFQPYRGKPAVRNDREGRGNVGIIRSPVRASTLPDCGGREVTRVPTAISAAADPLVEAWVAFSVAPSCSRQCCRHED